MRISEPKRRVMIIQALGFVRVDTFIFSFPETEDIRYIDLVNMSDKDFDKYFDKIVKLNTAPKNHPFYGQVEYTPSGRLVCHLCKLPFDSLSHHVNNTHGIRVRYYKSMFGLLKGKGLVSDELRQKLIDKITPEHSAFLAKQGEKTRFTKFSKGRTKDKVSPQLKTVLNNQLKVANMSKNNLKHLKKLNNEKHD